MSQVPPPKHFEIEAEQQASTALVRLRGEFDLAAEPHFDHSLEALEQSARSLVIDLTELTFIDSTGLRALLRAWERSRVNGHELTVVPGAGQVRHTMELTGLDTVLPIAKDPLPPHPPESA